MSRRSTRAASIDVVDYKESKNPADESDTDPMDLDSDEEEQSSQDAPISSMVQNRRTTKSSRARGGRKSSTGSSNSSSETDGEQTSRRSSSRSTRFKGGMKDPPSDSVRDLFQGVSDRLPQNDEESSDEDDVSIVKPRAVSNAKSPARRHSRARKNIRREETSDEDASDEEVEDESDFDDDDGDDDEDSDIKIQRILASRTETKAAWKKIGASMNTTEITNGSRWTQEGSEDDVLSSSAASIPEERFLVKWNGLSYLHCSWETQNDLVDQVEGAKTYLTTFFRKSVNGVLYDADERKDGDYFDPGFCQVDRILDMFYDDEKKLPSSREEEDRCNPEEDFDICLDADSSEFEDGTGRQFLVKWHGLNYSFCSYEFERDLMIQEVEFQEPLRAFYDRSKKPTKTDLRSVQRKAEESKRRAYKVFGDKTSMSQEEQEKSVGKYQKDLAAHVYKNGGTLRDYQAEGVTWYLSNYVNRRSCILADEMGLGKTLQTAAFVDLICQKLHRPGPFLICVPLSTLTHWQREFDAWTGLNTIVYHGSAEDRKWIREFEFAFPVDRPESVGANALFLNKCQAHRSGGTWMAQVVVTTPEMIVCEDASELAAVKWEVLVVDEAHRLKNHNSKLAQTLRNGKFCFKHKILLTGTPIQNDVQEFWTLLNFIDPENFDDPDDFMENYGDIKSKEKIDQLHELIRPYILRRLKEDVEKSVPPKEETLIEVEMTVLQKQYYRALYEKNVGFLHKNKKKALDGPSLNNLALQLRKVCNHCLLLNGVEEEVRSKDDDDDATFLSKGSGKFVLLDKLLPRLKEGGNRVLLFSQFKIMLDVLEDYLQAKHMKFERIDGSITGNKRQQAIDRFQDADAKDPPFVMLLSTRAGGVGINLTAADTCIIFDSDWNPQNDLQAQARCHRIGQTKNVKVYRLLTRKTYEMQMFHMSSLKMGLDQAVLKGFESGSSGDGVLTKDEVERLLRHGAYDIFNEEKSGSTEDATNAFIQQDIDTILQRNSTTVVHDNTGSNSNAKGGTFSKASFTVAKSPHKSRTTDDVDIDDPDFWKKMVGDAPVQVESALKPRQRKKTNYSESIYENQFDKAVILPSDSSASDDDESAESDEDEDNDDGDASKEKERTRWGGQKNNQWKKQQAECVLQDFERYGYGKKSLKELHACADQATGKLSESEVQRMAWSLILVALTEAARDDVMAQKRRAQRLAEKKKSTGDSLAESGGNATSTESAEVMLDRAFKKIWAGNSSWAKVVLEDAVNYVRLNNPKVNGSDLESKIEDDLMEAFSGSLWPSLMSRGWKEEEATSGKRFVYEGRSYRGPNEVLGPVTTIHPELSNMVATLRKAIEDSKQATMNKEMALKESYIRMDAGSVDIKMLQAFIASYAPLQLLRDRSSATKLSLGKRLIPSCSYMFEVYQLMQKVDGSHSLSEHLIVDGRAALPHPLWQVKHDEVLLNAIAKHGWIDRESACKSIVNDKEIKWGYPFELEDTNKANTLSDTETSHLRQTSSRAAVLLSKHPKIFEALKGCNKNLLVESYGLRHAPVEDESTSVRLVWKADDNILMKALSLTKDGNKNDEAVADLPLKKDMAKRAKTVIKKSGSSAPKTKPTATKENEDPTSNTSTAVIDQSNRCLVLLAEMIRGIVKGSNSKMADDIRLMAALAYEEARSLCTMFEKDEHMTGEMTKIADQIALARKSLKSQGVRAKNLLRVMIGLDPLASRSGGDVQFPSEESLVPATNGAQKKGPVRKAEGTTGEKAMTRSLKKASDKNQEGTCNFVKTDPTTGLQLTMVEVLILCTLCSEGLPPLISDPGNGDESTWKTLGTVLELAARDYYASAKNKLDRSKAQLQKFEGQPSNDHKERAAKRLIQDQADAAMKEEAAQLSRDFASDPRKLAKKSIMLLEKVRKEGFANSSHGQSKNSHKAENGLGTKVCCTWLGKEMTKLAKEYEILDSEGRTMSYTTTDLLATAEEGVGPIAVAAYMDKKSGRQVAGQVALLSRLRQIFLESSAQELKERLATALKNMKKLEDVWDKKPDWWDDSTVVHSFLLLQRLNEHGFNNIDNDTSGFGRPGGDTNPSLKELGLTKPIIQQRANQLVRELHALEEAAETLRLLAQRRNSGKKQKRKSSLESFAKTSKKAGVQTGLHAFFSKTPSSKKKSRVQDVEVIDVDKLPGSGKRKSAPQVIEIDSPSKAARKLAPSSLVQVIASPVREQHADETVRTVVNQHGQIELVSIPK